MNNGYGTIPLDDYTTSLPTTMWEAKVESQGINDIDASGHTTAGGMQYKSPPGQTTELSASRDRPTIQQN